MALTTRNVFTPSGQGYFTPDGRPLAGVEVKFTLVATGTTRPVSPFDATSGARVAAVATAITDAAGEFSINLWPNDRGANTSTEYICHIGNGYSDFRAALPSSATPIEWLDFQALGTPLTPAEVSALATHIADTTVHLVPHIDNALKVPRITADGTNVEYVVGGGGGGSGDVVGPASATDNAIVRYDGTTGKLIQNSAATIADTTGDITAGKYNTVTITGSGTPSLTVTGATAVSGTNTGDQTNISGNAATVTTNANMTGDVTSVGNATSIAAGVIVDADINANADIAVSKLASVTVSRALTSDVSGKVSASSVTSTELGYLSGVTSAIQTQLGNKIGTTLASGQVLVGNVSNVATAVTPTGDVTISNAGVTAIAAGVIVDDDINASAGIAVSKLAAVTASRALASDVSGKVSASSVTSTELGYLSGVTSAIQTQLGARELTANKGAVSGYCPLDSNAKVATTYLPDSILGALKYQGTWNASTNSPAIPVAGAGNLGHFYVVSVAGVTNIDGIADWEIGDWIVSNGTAWGKVDNSDKVSSIFGRAGAVTAQSGDYNTSQVTENTNLYYTDARARGSLTVTFTGSSGSGTYNSSTGALNIPTYTLAGLGGQPLDATLTALAGVTTSADQVIYATGADTFGTTSLTTFGRSLIDDVDAAAARTTIGAEATITAGTTAQYWRGDKAWVDFFTSVRAATLTGLSTATNAVISATDTVLEAFGKLQAQFTAHFSNTSNPHSVTAAQVGAPTTSGTGATGTWGIGISGNAATAAAWATGRTLTVGDTGKSVDGSGNVSWSHAEIGATVAATASKIVLRGSAGEITGARYNNGSFYGTGQASAKNHFAQANLGSDAIATGWISSAFGDATGTRIVVGQHGGEGAIGAHSGNLDAWEKLVLQGTSFSFRDSAAAEVASINSAGVITSNADTFRLVTARTPASASASGNTGDICWDSSYIYVCIATNTWRRIAHATW